MKPYIIFARTIAIIIIGIMTGCTNSEENATSPFCKEVTFTLNRTDEGYKGTMEIAVTFPPGDNLKKIVITESNKKYIKKIICLAPDASVTGKNCNFYYPDNYYKDGFTYSGNSFVESVSGDMITYTAENTSQNIRTSAGTSPDYTVTKENENCPCVNYNGNWKIEVLLSKDYYEPESVSKKLKVCFYFEEPILADPKPD